MEDKLSFLETEETAAVEIPVEPEAPVEQTETDPAPEQPRDEHGRFAPKDEAKPEPVMVPLAALHEARDKVRDLEGRLAAQQPAYQPQEVPDVFADPEGFTATLQAQMQQTLYQQTLQWSQRFAEQKYGADTVREAVEWGKAQCAADPGFNASVFSHADPIGFAVEQYQRDQIASQVSMDEFQKFKAWQAAQAQAQQQPQASAPAPTPPRSLASVPSSGGVTHVPVGPGQAFDTLFR